MADWRLPGLRELMDDKIGLLKQFDVDELAEPPEPPDHPPSPSATTPPPTPTPPCPDDGDTPAFDRTDLGSTPEEWRRDAPPDGARGWTWDEVADGMADDG